MTIDGTALRQTNFLWFFAVISLIFSIIDLLVILLLQKSSRVKKQSRLLTQNVVLADSLLHVSVVFVKVLSSGIDEVDRRVHFVNYMLIILSACATIYCSLVILVSVERLISIRWPARFYSLMHVSRVRHLIIGIYLAITFLGGFGISYVALRCKERAQTCQDDYFYTILGSALATVALITFITLSVISVYIAKVSQDHVNRLRHQYPASNLGTSTHGLRTIIHISIFAIAIALMAVSLYVFSTAEQKIKPVFGFLFYLCLVFNTCASLYHYVLSKKECQLVLQRIFCTWNEKGLKKFEQKRIEIYNIPTVQDP